MVKPECLFMAAGDSDCWGTGSTALEILCKQTKQDYQTKDVKSFLNSFKQFCFVGKFEEKYLKTQLVSSGVYYYTKELGEMSLQLGCQRQQFRSTVGGTGRWMGHSNQWYG